MEGFQVFRERFERGRQNLIKLRETILMIQIFFFLALFLHIGWSSMWVGKDGVGCACLVWDGMSGMCWFRRG